jgi:hypothetical protein
VASEPERTSDVDSQLCLCLESNPCRNRSRPSHQLVLFILSIKLRLLKITGDKSWNLFSTTTPNRQLRRNRRRKSLCTPLKFRFLVIDIVQSMTQNLTRLLPIRKRNILQPSINIEPKVIVSAIANMGVLDPMGDFARLARHLLESAQDGDSAVFDLDHVAEASAYAEDEDLRGFGEEASDLLDQDFAGVVVSETGVDEFDVVAPAFDGFEEGCGCGCCSCDLPDGAVCESGAVVVGFEEGGAGVDVVFRDGQSDTRALSVGA